MNCHMMLTCSGNKIFLLGHIPGTFRKVKSWRRLQFMATSFGSRRWFGQPAAETHPHLMAEGEVTPGISQKEFYDRRRSLVKSAAHLFKGVKSVSHHLFVFPSAATTYMSNDVPYPFRQNTDFLYFCGFQEPDSMLLIEASNDSTGLAGDHVSRLFVPRRDAAKELWDGPRSGIEGALTLTGVDAADNSSEIEKYLQHYIENHKDYVLWYNDHNPVHLEFHNRVAGQVMRNERHRSVEDPMQLTHSLRLQKSPAEIRLMQQSADIASEAIQEVMKFSRPGINEAHLWAKMDFECRMRGAEFLAYPPVVAGGPRANIIHYITNNQVVRGDQLVLMDAGCELHGYASDLTRTWPVSGQFSAAQKLLYNATLRVQEACIQLCTAEYSLNDIFQQMLSLLSAELTQLGIISPDKSYDQRVRCADKFCPHHVSHYLGMDVHDTASISRHSKLLPNSVVTVEPGIYIPENDYTVSPEFRGIGIRIEDNILVTDTQPVNLSASCPKRVEDIEDLMTRR